MRGMYIYILYHLYQILLSRILLSLFIEIKKERYEQNFRKYIT
jgi:hypothetical protein